MPFSPLRQSLTYLRLALNPWSCNASGMCHHTQIYVVLASGGQGIVAKCSTIWTTSLLDLLCFHPDLFHVLWWYMKWKQHSTGQYYQANEGETKTSTVWSGPRRLLNLLFSVSELLSPKKKTKNKNQRNKKFDLQLKHWLCLQLNQRHLTIWQRTCCQALGKIFTSHPWLPLS